jgi:hypothetical protein
MKNWRTTLIGLAGSLYAILLPLLSTGTPPSPEMLGLAISIAILGWLSADGKSS